MAADRCAVQRYVVAGPALSRGSVPQRRCKAPNPWISGLYKRKWMLMLPACIFLLHLGGLFPIRLVQGLICTSNDSGRHLQVAGTGSSPLAPPRYASLSPPWRRGSLACRTFSREVTACHHLTSFITEHACRSAVLVLFLAWWMSQHQTARTA